MNAGQYRDALPELQRARQNPNARLKAMNLARPLLSRARNARSRGQAARRSRAARSLAMDAMKKEIVYNLGLVYEQMGDAEKSVACMKQIYEADYGYKDVASARGKLVSAGIATELISKTR